MFSRERLIILDADGTTIDAFGAITKAFAQHGMDIGDLTRFQKRRHLFKYLGGLKEFPRNLQRHMRASKRAAVIATLTEIYREKACAIVSEPNGRGVTNRATPTTISVNPMVMATGLAPVRGNIEPGARTAAGGPPNGHMFAVEPKYRRSNRRGAETQRTNDDLFVAGRLPGRSRRRHSQIAVSRGFSVPLCLCGEESRLNVSLSFRARLGRCHTSETLVG